jgi:lambda family phage portal protein
MSFFDKIIEAVNPELAFKRERFRAAIEVIRQYDAGSRSRRTKDWRAWDGGQNNEIAAALPTLRARSRDLVKNNPFAKRAIQIIAANTVGSGIKPAPEIEGRPAIERRIKEAFRQWSETTECDWEGQNTFYGLQELCMRSIAEAGEVLIRKRRNSNMKIPFQLQVLEPEFIDSSKNYQPLNGGGFIMYGVEFNEQGKRVAYHLYDRHPKEFFEAQSKRVPASEILHVYNVERPGQVRGVPFGVSAMLRLKDFDDYEAAQLVRQKIAACFSVFVQDTGADNITGSLSQDDTERLGRVEPGIIEYLPPGKSIQFASPPPAEGYGEYSTKILQAIAAGYGVTYEALTGDLSNVNFSSARMGWLEFQRLVEKYQKNMLVPMLCDPVWNWFMEAAELRGIVTKKYTARWTPPRREMIDPSKEVKGMSDAVRNGFQSWSETVRQLGHDPEDVIDELKADYAAFDANGFKLECDPRAEGQAQAGAEGEGAERSDMDNVKQLFDAYGVAVRAGSITPTIEDEKAMRQLAGLPPMTAQATSLWNETKGVRKPITLLYEEKQPTGESSESTEDNASDE